VHGRKHFIGPRVVIAIPSGITAVERRAVYDSAERAGARRVYLVEEPMAAAIGAGLPVIEPTASMIVDIGGGTTEVAIISLAYISVCESVRVAGDDFDEAIVRDPTSMEVRGRDLISGLPRKTTVTAEEIRESLQEPVTQIIEAVKHTLELAKPELAADLVENGITMAGGSSLLRGLPTVLSNATGLDVKLAEDPLTCVARGTSVYLENLELWKETMESDVDEA
jgi:rod shape-determining protein MreB